MKRITMSFYIDDNNHSEEAISDIKGKVILCSSSPETITIEENEEQLSIQKCPNLTVIAHPDYFIYRNNYLPSIVSFDDEGRLINSLKYNSTGSVKIFDTSDKESKSKMNSFIKGKTSGYKTYNVYKIKSLENSYYIEEKEELNEDIVINNPYNSFKDIYNKKYFDELTDDNFEKVKDLFKKSCKNQSNMEYLLEFLFEISLDNYYKFKLKFESHHIKELVQILKDNNISISTCAKVFHGFSDWWFKDGYERTNFQFYVLNILYGIEEKYINIIKEKINDKSFSCRYRYNIVFKELDVFLSYLYFSTYCCHNSYWLSRKDATADICRMASYSLAELEAYCNKNEIDIEYDELRNKILPISNAAVSYTSVISHKTGMLISTNTLANVDVKVGSDNKKLLLEALLISLENLKGRGRNTIRESIIAHILTIDSVNKDLNMAADMNSIVKKEKLLEVQNCVMKVRLKNTKKS